MKKLLALILVALMLVSITACNNPQSGIESGGDNTKDNVNKDNGGDNTKDNVNKDNGTNNNNINSGDVNVDDIVFSSVYSDGVAIVNLKDEEGKAFVIDKQGNIIFDFPLADGWADSSVNHLRFENDLLVYGGKCYDTKGNITTPESVGATTFIALEQGKYIVAEKISSTYNSEKKELGLLNTDFEWILPLKEGHYDLYNSNIGKYKDFFWNEIVFSTDNTIKCFMSNSSTEVVYCSDGRKILPEDVHAECFFELYEDKYILAQTKDNNRGKLGILNANGEWVLTPSEELWEVYESWHGYSLDIKKDTLVCEFYDRYNIPSISNDLFVLSERETETSGILYYDIKTKTSKLITEDAILSSYCNAPSTALKKIIYHTDGEIELVYGSMDSEDKSYVYDWGIEELKTAAQYILIKTRQESLKDFIDNSNNADYEGMMDVYSVCDQNMNWILKSIPADEVELKGDYLRVYSTWGYIENGYYNLRTGGFSVDKPADFDNEENNDSDVYKEFDFTSITNHFKHTDFVNGKAAVALLNSAVNEIYITVVDESGAFLFEPVKVEMTSFSGYSFSFPFYFDGEYIVLANRDTCGSGVLNATMTLYTFDINGKKIAEWTASDNLDAWSCHFEYSDGVVVFWLISGQYSDYYRESHVKYYTYDYKTLFE